MGNAGVHSDGILHNLECSGVIVSYGQDQHLGTIWLATGSQPPAEVAHKDLDGM